MPLSTLRFYLNLLTFMLEPKFSKSLETAVIQFTSGHIPTICSLISQTFIILPTPAAESTKILRLTQQADNIRNEGKFLHLFTNHSMCWKFCPSTRRHSSHLRRGSYLPSEDSLREYWKFAYECFLSALLPFEGYCCKLFLSHNPRRKNHTDHFSSVSTWRLCFVFLSPKCPVVLSLFTKLWIVCLLGTLSSRNLRRNFRRHFPADPYFTWVSYRNTRCSKVSRTMSCQTADW
jgi:hypothetical protein